MEISAERYCDDTRKRLIPFINEHHSDGNHMFWPDLAIAHYANKVRAYLDAVKYQLPAKAKKLSKRIRSETDRGVLSSIDQLRVIGKQKASINCSVVLSIVWNKWSL